MPKKSLAILSLFFLLTACSSSETIKIGMIAGLTGMVSDLGTAGRDGATLAVEEANRRGGVNGKMIELLTRDDKQDRQTCRRGVTELIEAGVTAIVGPMTSAMALEMLPQINRHAIPTISPTVSSNRLAGLDDYFFSIIPASSAAAKRAAEYVYYKKKFRNLLVVYDRANNAYTESWYEALKSHFESLGEGRVDSVGYISKNSYDYLALARVIAEKRQDCLFILASAFDTAMICQQLAKLRAEVPIMASEWSLTEDLLQYGGKSVEGIEIFHSFDRNNASPGYLEFSTKFQARFGYTADFGSAYAYNAMKILLQAMEKGTTPEQIKRNILDNAPYQGVQREIRFNPYGDAMREYTLLKIKNGRVVTL